MNCLSCPYTGGCYPGWCQFVPIPAHPLARFALNLPVPVDGDLPGGRWCDECRIRTNHDGAMHRQAEAEAPDEY